VNILVRGLFERARTRQRGIAASWDPATLTVASSSTLIQCLVENGLSAVDRMFSLGETYLEAETEYGEEEQRVQKQIADDRAATRRAIIAMETVTEGYVHSIDLFAAAVEKEIADAKAVASEIENRQLRLLEEGRTDLAEGRALAVIAETDGKILLETIERNFVELDIAKINVDVARGRVRAVMAELDVTRAELNIVKAEVEQAMTVVRAAELRANIAAIFAEIVTKELIKTTYAVTKAEIEAGFDFVRDRLDAVLTLSGIRETRERMRLRLEELMQGAVTENAVAKLVEDGIRWNATVADEYVASYDRDQTAGALRTEEDAKGDLYRVEQDLDAKQRGDGGWDLKEIEKRTWATELIEKAETALAEQRTLQTWTSVGIWEHLRREGGVKEGGPSW